MRFYMSSSARFRQTSCFTCPERLDVSKHVKTPSVFACLTRKLVKHDHLNYSKSLFIPFFLYSLCFYVQFVSLQSYAFYGVFAASWKHRKNAVRRCFWEHILLETSCLAWFPGWRRKKHRVLHALGSRRPLCLPCFCIFIVFLRGICDLQNRLKSDAFYGVFAAAWKHR